MGRDPNLPLEEQPQVRRAEPDLTGELIHAQRFSKMPGDEPQNPLDAWVTCGGGGAWFWDTGNLRSGFTESTETV